MKENLTMPRTPGIRERIMKIHEDNEIMPRNLEGTHEDALGVQKAAGRHHPHGTSVGTHHRR